MSAAGIRCGRTVYTTLGDNMTIEATAPEPRNAKKGAPEEPLVQHHKKLRETHSSGDSDDPLHTPEERVVADPALEPELARQREALAREDRDAADRLEEAGTDRVAKKNR